MPASLHASHRHGRSSSDARCRAALPDGTRTGRVRAIALWPAMSVLGLCLLLPASAGQGEVPRGAAAVRERPGRVAIFPVENLTGRTAPLGEIRAMLADRLRSRGFPVLDEASLNRVVTRHRIRYTAGLDRDVAHALKAEAGVEAVLIPTLELYDEANPPKVAMFCRLVATGDQPAVVWIDGAGQSGDDAPGLLGLGLVEDPFALLARVVDSLAASLARHRLETDDRSSGAKADRKFQPKLLYRSDLLDAAKPYSIAVLPFFNKTDRKYAGEIMALHMIRNLMTFRNFEIVEPGVVRQELLRFRIIMSDGVSLPETDTILDAVNADLVLNGEVLEYRDYRGPEGVAKVDFSVLFIERKARRVVFSSYSQNRSDDGVFFFDLGRVNTAHAMASRMARTIGERMGGERPDPRSAR
jgi:hypothetical protein